MTAALTPMSPAVARLWRHNLEREDAQGRSWSCSGGIYVTNDFGDLVQVPA